MRNAHKGFSLIELLIVVAIILIIAAIAIPNFLHSKIAANQSSAVGSLRSLNTACVSFSTSYGQFPTSLTDLGPLASGGTPSSTSADLIDSVLASGSKSGYTFVYTAGTNNQSYSITATPIIRGFKWTKYVFHGSIGSDSDRPFRRGCDRRQHPNWLVFRRFQTTESSCLFRALIPALPFVSLFWRKGQQHIASHAAIARIAGVDEQHAAGDHRTRAVERSSLGPLRSPS